jgi:hypothetical protein
MPTPDFTACFFFGCGSGFGSSSDYRNRLYDFDNLCRNLGDNWSLFDNRGFFVAHMFTALSLEDLE